MLIKLMAPPTSILLIEQIGTEDQAGVNVSKQRMCIREIIKQTAMCGNNDSSRIDTLFRKAHKAVTFVAIGAALVAAANTRISRRNALNARRNTLPGRYLLREQRQLAALAGHGLLCP